MAAFEISRSTTIAAPRERVHGLIADFHRWRAWSPWEGVDPDLRREYGDVAAGPGARYAWEGNRKAGKGSMAITDADPGRIDIDLAFEKPWKAHNDVVFTLEEAGGATNVTWTMRGENKGLAALFARVFNMDKMLGRDFEKGLAGLKRTAEEG